MSNFNSTPDPACIREQLETLADALDYLAQTAQGDGLPWILFQLSNGLMRIADEVDPRPGSEDPAP